MRLVVVTTCLAVSALALARPDPVKQDQPAPPRKELSKSDAQKAKDLSAKAAASARAGKYGEAQASFREILDLRARVLGENHFETADARRMTEEFQKLAALPEAEKAEFRTTYALTDQLKELENKGHYAEAMKPAEKVLEIYRRLLGPDSWSAAVAAQQYGELLYGADRYADAEAQFREALRIVRKAAGEDHPSFAGLSGDIAMSLEKQGKNAEARKLHDVSLAINERLRGEHHPATAVSANNLACFLDRQAHLPEAERHHRKALATLLALKDEEGSKLATTYNNLGLNLYHQGKYAEAEAMYQESLTLRRKISGDDHPDTGRVYMNLATNREARGYIAEAEPLLRKALESYRKAYGESSSQTAWAKNNLGVNLRHQNKYAEAERLFREALGAVERAPTRMDREIAFLSNNLAYCLQAQEKYAESAKLCEKALASLRADLGPDHPEVAVCMNNVAVNYHYLGKYAEAERYLRDALEVTQRRLGAAHPQTAEARGNLAVNLHEQGLCDEAERQFREVLAVQRKVLGNGHPSTSRTYKNLSACCCARGHHARVEELAPHAAASFEIARSRISFTGLEGAGSAADISPLPALAVAAAACDKPEAAWQAVEQDLARGLLDDLSARPLSAEDRQREKQLLTRLGELDEKIAVRENGPASAGGPTADELRGKRDEAQAEFVRFQSDVTARYGVAAGKVYGLARIQERLAEDAALVTWVDLPDQVREKRTDLQGNHWACVVRKRGTPVWVRLRGTGANGAWTSDDRSFAARVRSAFAKPPTHAPAPWVEKARQLAAQRLDPLAEQFKARPDLPAVKHLIVLPCYWMRGIPVEALASDVTVSYAPSGTMLAWLAEQKAGRATPSPNLLALGDPTFKQQPDGGEAAEKQPPREAGRRETFTRLQGTRQEVLGVARVFSETRLLMGPKATESNLNSLAESGDLRGFRYLHFATHGILDDRHPMRSALILAPEKVAARPDRGPAVAASPDGRLTAERILRHWKLDADLVTLSACETGVGGTFADGEGYLGFSQALFVAGARSMVLSLWQVEDSATALLMARFYENLLGTPEGTVKPMSKARALSEAKKWLRELGPDEVRELAKDLPKRGTRGRIEARQGAGKTDVVRTYDHPYYWSGFILVGDPQ